jgi:hypothetical protein
VRDATWELREPILEFMFWMVVFVLTNVGFQGFDGGVKHLVAGVGHLGGRKRRSGWVGGTTKKCI